jgi:hypothetical protein
MHSRGRPGDILFGCVLSKYFIHASAFGFVHSKCALLLVPSDFQIE